MKPEENILSEDLLGSVKEGDNPLVIHSKTIKKNKILKEARKRLREDEPQEEVVAEVKKISKKQQKRIAQIAKRKERAANRDVYLDIIKQNQVSDLEKTLLMSSRQINQTMSLKQTLSLLIKKEKAGMTLTQEELDVLYVKKRNNDDLEELDEAEKLWLSQVPLTITKETKPENMDPSDEMEQEEENDGSTLFSLDDMFGATSSEPHVTEVKEKRKKSKNKKPRLTSEEAEDASKQATLRPQAQELSKSDKMDVESTNQTQHIEEKTKEEAKIAEEEKPKKPFQNLGKHLMAQFQKIKEKQALSSQDDVSKILKETDDMYRDGYIRHDSSYKVDSLVLPVDSLGNIVASEGEVFEAPKKRNTHLLKRPQDVVMSRINLPVCRMEQEIVEAVNSNDIIILCGETGSGKSTQVPQFLYEYGYAEKGMIAIAQPRRVAVTSTAERVSYEMGDPLNEVSTKQNDKAEGKLVGYQIRYDSSTVGTKTKLKYLTDGILLREVTQDILLRQYSVVILDEAHERNVNTDILLGMLSRTVILRSKLYKKELAKWKKLPESERENYLPPSPPLRLIIMSATIRVSDFQNPGLFHMMPPVIQVEARQYPVTTHFSKRTEMKNYLKETHRKVCQIHRKLPQGGVLVFLTGKREILYMCNKLKKSLGQNRYGSSFDPKRKDKGGEDEETLDEENNIDFEKLDIDASKEYEKIDTLGDEQDEIDEDDIFSSDDEIDSDDDIDRSDDEEIVIPPELEVEMPLPEIKEVTPTVIDQQEEDEASSGRNQLLDEILGYKNEPSSNEVKNQTESSNTDPVCEVVDEESSPPLKPLILPLYAMMPAELQARIFQEVPPGYRLIVVATNVAETSITIPNVSYVVDPGRFKEKVISNSSDSNNDDSGSGVIAHYAVNFVTKASADQRQGRAGRTGPGHCYRLYSSNFYHNHMKTFADPEITVTPLEEVVLSMKAMGIDHIESFPFPTPPPRTSIIRAMRMLSYIGAIVQKKKQKLDFLTADLVKIGTSMNGKNVEDDSSIHGMLTDLGKMMAKFPLHPRYSKILLVALNSNTNKNNLRTLFCHALTLVATIAERSVFMIDEQRGNKSDDLKFDPDAPPKSGENKVDSDDDMVMSEEDEDEDDEEDDEEEKKKRKQNYNKLFYHSTGDFIARLRATGAFIYTVYSAINVEVDSDNEDNKNTKKSGKQLDSNNINISRKLLASVCTSNPEIKDFCAENYLHLPTLNRILDLRSQLQNICENLMSEMSYLGENSPFYNLIQSCSEYIDHSAPSHLKYRNTLGSNLSPPSSADENALVQALISGFSDSIARRAPLSIMNKLFSNAEQVSNAGLNVKISDDLKPTRRNRLTAYFSANPGITEPLYIHPQSNLFPQNISSVDIIMPEYIIYGELVRNTIGDKLYMGGVSIANPNWMSQLVSDSPLLTWGLPSQSSTSSSSSSLSFTVSSLSTSSQPFYDKQKDVVSIYVIPRFGAHKWVLPSISKPLEEFLTNLFGEEFTSPTIKSSLPPGYRDHDVVYRWFTRFLLENALSLPLNNILTSSKLILNTSEVTNSGPRPYIPALLSSIVSNKISSKKQLLLAISNNNTLLFNELEPLIKLEYRKNFRLSWKEFISKIDRLI